MFIRLDFISLLPNIKDMKFRKDIQDDVEKGKFPKALKTIHLLPESLLLKEKIKINKSTSKKQTYKETENNEESESIFQYFE